MKKVKKELFLFGIVYILFLIRAILGNTTFSEYIKIYGTYLYITFGIGVVLLFFKIFQYDKFNIKELICIIGVVIFFGISYLKSGYVELLILMLLLISTKNIELEEIVKIHFYTYLTITIIAIVCSLLGIIENYFTYSIDRGYRYSLGNTYSTDFSAGIFYLVLDWAYLKRNNWKRIYSFSIIVISVIVYKITDAKANMIFSIVISIILLISNFKIFNKKGFRKIVSYSFLILAICSITIQEIYIKSQSEILKKIDIIFNNRLSYGAYAINNYGLSLFGRHINFYGNGWGTKSTTYFYVDNAYLQLTLIYGIVILAFFCVGYLIAIRKRKDIIDSKLLIILFVIAVSNIIEPRFYNLIYNPFIFVISLSFFNARKENKDE